MSYEGGGSPGTQGPAGATGATGATGGISFSGPFGSVLWYDGTGVTGVTGLRWENDGPGGYVLLGGPSGNYFTFDDGAGNMQIGLGQTDYGNGITLSAGNTVVVLTDAITGIEVPMPGQLQVIINGNAGASGDVLTSNGSITTWQAIPTPPVTLTQGILDLYTDITWTGDGSGYYADFTLSQPVYSNTNVMVTMINTDVTTATFCWIINATPNANGLGDLRIWIQAEPDDAMFASYLITNPGSAPV